MHRTHKYLGSLLLGLALVAPIGLQGNNFREDSREDAREQNERERRYYDRDYKDYHRWDNREDGRYRSWGTERHEVYRPFYKLHRDQQRAYWKYRHEHPDRDDRR